MWLTLLAIACVVGFALYPEYLPLSLSALEFAALMVVGGALTIFLTILLNTLILQPMSQLEQKLIPNLVDHFRKNIWLRICRNFLFFLAFVSFLLAVAMLTINDNHRIWLVWAWIIVLGVSLDLLKSNWIHLTNLLNPNFIVKELEQEAKRAVQISKDKPLWESLDNLSEVAIRGIEKSKLALSSQAVQAFPPIMHAFFAASKSISHLDLDQTVENQTGQDEASYTLFYLLQRLELIFDKALTNRLETVCRQLVMSLGKIIIYAAKLDLSLVSFPTHFLVKFGLKAQQHHFDEVTELTTSTLLEIAKRIINEVDLTYAELKNPFQSIINGLENIAKGSFKKNKQGNFKVLTQPLRDLKTLMENSKIATHRDAPAIMAEIDRALSEFDTLEQIMRSVPVMPEFPEGPEELKP